MGSRRLGITLMALLSACGGQEEPRRAPRKTVVGPVEFQARIGEPKVISEGEDVRIVRIPAPSAPDDRNLDTACLIYRNERLHAAQLVCPDIPDLERFADHGED